MKNLSGSPITGTVSFSAATTTAFTLKLTTSNVAYTPTANERIIVTDIVASTNDSSPALVTIDDGAGGQVLFQGYMSTTAQLQGAFAPDSCSTRPGTMPRATLGSLTAAKAATVTFHGFVVRV